tara:strand:+ start:135 stop:1085 length:951 start_codon:yes stop_codon:yes gene_type:complete
MHTPALTRRAMTGEMMWQLSLLELERDRFEAEAKLAVRVLDVVLEAYPDRSVDEEGDDNVEQYLDAVMDGRAAEVRHLVDAFVKLQTVRGMVAGIVAHYTGEGRDSVFRTHDHVATVRWALVNLVSSLSPCEELEAAWREAVGRSPGLKKKLQIIQELFVKAKEEKEQQDTDVGERLAWLYQEGMKKKWWFGATGSACGKTRKLLRGAHPEEVQIFGAEVVLPLWNSDFGVKSKMTPKQRDARLDRIWQWVPAPDWAVKEFREGKLWDGLSAEDTLTNTAKMLFPCGFLSDTLATDLSPMAEEIGVKWVERLGKLG